MYIIERLLRLEEAQACAGVSQPPEYHDFDVLGHLRATAEAARDMVSGRLEEAVRREISPLRDRIFPIIEGLRCRTECDKRALFVAVAAVHDVGKIHTRSTGSDGRIHFYGHDERGAAIARQMLSVVGFCNLCSALGERMTRYHMRPHSLLEQGKPSRRAVLKYFRVVRQPEAELTLGLSLADRMGQRANPSLEELGERARLSAEVIDEFKSSTVYRPPARGLIDGFDVVKLGISPGPIVGEILKAVGDAEASGQIAEKEEALALARRMIKRSEALI